METIAYQGIRGSFSWHTLEKAFGESKEYRECTTFEGVFELLSRNEVEYGLIPIENSLVGAIYENYDFLQKYRVTVVSEYYTRVEQALIGTFCSEKKKERIKMIKKVVSHPKALEQCTRFFKEHPWIESEMYFDTAAAVAYVADTNDRGVAAIGGAFSANLYSLHVLEENIQDVPDNWTRFLLIKRTREIWQGNKCSLLCSAPHQPGALWRLLEIFALNEANITKIISRPIKGSFFEYVFYIDVVFHAIERLYTIVEMLQKNGALISILGVYDEGTL